MAIYIKKPLVMRIFIPDPPTYLTKNADGKYRSNRNKELSAQGGSGDSMMLDGSPIKANVKPTTNPQSALTNSTLPSKSIPINIFT